MAILPLDADEANRFKSFRAARRLIRRLMGHLDSRLRTGPARVKNLKAEIGRLSQREQELSEENDRLKQAAEETARLKREALARLETFGSVESDIRAIMKKTVALMESSLKG